MFPNPFLFTYHSQIQNLILQYYSLLFLRRSFFTPEIIYDLQRVKLFTGNLQNSEKINIKQQNNAIFCVNLIFETLILSNSIRAHILNNFSGGGGVVGFEGKHGKRGRWTDFRSLFTNLTSLNFLSAYFRPSRLRRERYFLVTYFIMKISHERRYFTNI